MRLVGMLPVRSAGGGGVSAALRSAVPAAAAARRDGEGARVKAVEAAMRAGSDGCCLGQHCTARGGVVAAHWRGVRGCGAQAAGGGHCSALYRGRGRGRGRARSWAWRARCSWAWAREYGWRGDG